jgi:Flp pilus assembly protein CpaB
VLATVVVLVLVAAFLLVAGVAGWMVRRLWVASGSQVDATAAPAQED